MNAVRYVPEEEDSFVGAQQQLQKKHQRALVLGLGAQLLENSHQGMGLSHTPKLCEQKKCRCVHAHAQADRTKRTCRILISSDRDSGTMLNTRNCD